jgi:hypothetical protein
MLQPNQQLPPSYQMRELFRGCLERFQGANVVSCHRHDGTMRSTNALVVLAWGMRHTASRSRCQMWVQLLMDAI